jgi:hypothetical protein
MRVPATVSPRRQTSSWLVRQLAGVRSGLAEEVLYAEHKRGHDLRDLESAHPLVHLIPQYPVAILAAPWRTRLGHALESHRAHMVVIALVVLDLIAVFGEVMLTNVCGIEREKAEARVAGESDADAHSALLREERIHAWEGGLHKFSIALVVVLLVYVAGLLLAFGTRFFGKVWYVLDAVVLIVTLVLEFSLTNDSSGFLPAILSWRVLRILHGFFVTEESSTSEVVALRERLRGAISFARWQETDDVAALRQRLDAIGSACRLRGAGEADDVDAISSEAAVHVVVPSESSPAAAIEGCGEAVRTCDEPRE